MHIKTLFLIILLALSGNAHATWSLDNRESELTFVSTKAVDIAEVLRFNSLSGHIADNGKAEVLIELTSVDTGIEIRNQRMQSILFETDSFPVAAIRTRVDRDLLDDMHPGATKHMELEFELDIHGKVTAVPARVMIAKLSDSLVTVTSSEPIILTASDAGLDEGVEALRKIVNLPSIGNSVPVSFVITFIKMD